MTYGKGWEKAGGEMFVQNAESDFMHRGVRCWTKKVKSGTFKNSHNGYFRMVIPGVTHQRDVDRLFIANGGVDVMPNGGSFSYLVLTTNPGEVVVGFDGQWDHNITAPLTLEQAEGQIRRAVDFILDHGLGRTVPAQA